MVDVGSDKGMEEFREQEETVIRRTIDNPLATLGPSQLPLRTETGPHPHFALHDLIRNRCLKVERLDTLELAGEMSSAGLGPASMGMRILGTLSRSECKSVCARHTANINRLYSGFAP